MPKNSVNDRLNRLEKKQPSTDKLNFRIVWAGENHIPEPGSIRLTWGDNDEKYNYKPNKRAKNGK